MNTNTELLTWGWTSYKKTGWINDDGERNYTAYLESVPAAGQGWVRIWVTFWTRHPCLFLREAVAEKRTVSNMYQFVNDKS